MPPDYAEVGQTEEWNIAISYTYQLVGHISKILEYKTGGQIEMAFLHMRNLYHLTRQKMKPELRVKFDYAEKVLIARINQCRDISSQDGTILMDDSDFMEFFDELMDFMEAKGLITPKGDDPMNAYRGGRR